MHIKQANFTSFSYEIIKLLITNIGLKKKKYENKQKATYFSLNILLIVPSTRTRAS